jgi:spore maturation protein SpmB
MTTFFACVIPCIFLVSFAFAIFKKVKLFDSFSEGAKGAIPLVVSIFPYIATAIEYGKFRGTRYDDLLRLFMFIPVFLRFSKDDAQRRVFAIERQPRHVTNRSQLPVSNR